MERIVLRQWRDSDLEPLVAMNSDPEVMRFFPALMSRAETAASLTRMRRGIEERGWGLWAVDVDGGFAGLTGLNIPGFQAYFTPCTEIGWRFRKEFWGRGLAFQAARAALRFGFESLNLAEVFAFTAPSNVRSQRLMLRLEFEQHGEFEHPLISEGHDLRRHVLYRMKRQDWFSNPQSSESFIATISNCASPSFRVSP